MLEKESHSFLQDHFKEKRAKVCRGKLRAATTHDKKSRAIHDGIKGKLNNDPLPNNSRGYTSMANSYSKWSSNFVYAFAFLLFCSPKKSQYISKLLFFSWNITDCVDWVKDIVPTSLAHKSNWIIIISWQTCDNGKYQIAVQVINIILYRGATGDLLSLTWPRL